MSVYQSHFLDFNILGGMPAVVAEYIQKGTFEGSLDTQKQLIADYKEDIGEALTKQGYELFYYKRDDSTLEEDFFIRSASSLIPIEVKAKSGRSKSMRTLIGSDAYSDIRYGFKLSANNIGHENSIYTFPYFCTFLLKHLKRFMTSFHPLEEQESL